MFVFIGLVIGVVWGVVHVRKRQGSGFDMAQYAVIWGMIGAILGLALSIGLARML